MLDKWTRGIEIRNSRHILLLRPARQDREIGDIKSLNGDFIGTMLILQFGETLLVPPYGNDKYSNIDHSFCESVADAGGGASNEHRLIREWHGGERVRVLFARS